MNARPARKAAILHDFKGFVQHVGVNPHLIVWLLHCRNEQPKRRKLQPATPMSRSVQEALGDFVADDSIFRQHMKQTPVALRTRRATRFGGL